jgi:uncharacterized membrane protein
MRKIAPFLLALTLTVTFAACGSETKPPDAASQKVTADEGLVISVAELSETAKFYPVTVDSVTMEVVAVKAPDGSIRTALNTCQVCYGSPKAYFVQKGNTLVCQNCGNSFPMDRVGIEAGGCNPVPILDVDKTFTGDTITVNYDFLKKNTALFKTWRK